jgi:hypothetical protein
MTYSTPWEFNNSINSRQIIVRSSRLRLAVLRIPYYLLFMYILREYFVTKPGQAGKLAAMMKEISAIASPGKTRVMTDVTGEFNRVIMETEVASLAEIETRQQEYMSNPDWKAKMKGYTDLWETGGREILRIV